VEDLADRGGDGRLTGLMTGVTGSGTPPAPETVVPVSVFSDHVGLDKEDDGWYFDE
jgi:hypothetical protein